MSGEFPVAATLHPVKPITADVLVGKTHEGNREFLGLIDEVRIWNRALDEDEVIEQMESGYFEIFAVDPRQKLTTTWGHLKDLTTIKVIDVRAFESQQCNTRNGLSLFPRLNPVLSAHSLPIDK